jgi:hypothetical protein
MFAITRGEGGDGACLWVPVGTSISRCRDLYRWKLGERTFVGSLQVWECSANVAAEVRAGLVEQGMYEGCLLRPHLAIVPIQPYSLLGSEMENEN